MVISKRRILLMHLCIGQCVLDILNISVIFILDKIMRKKCSSDYCQPMPFFNDNNKIVKYLFLNKNQFLCMNEDLIEVALIVSYYWGIIPSSIFGVWLPEVYSPCTIITVSAIFSGFFQSIIPFLLSPVHYIGICIIRFILGILRGTIFYANLKLVSCWIPRHEYGFMMAALYGNNCGLFFCWILMSYTSSIGWGYSCFLSGIIVVVWTIIFICAVVDNPYSHSSITQEELKYLTECNPLITNALVQDVQMKKPPLWKIIKNRSFLAYIFLNLGDIWSSSLLILALAPKYMCYSNIDVKMKNSLYLSIPLLLNFVFGFFFGLIGDSCLQHKYMTVTTSRKFFVLFSHTIPGILLLGLSFPSKDHWLHTFVLNYCLYLLQGATILTNAINPFDLSPHYFNTLYAISNIMECLCGTLLVALIEYILNFEKFTRLIITFPFPIILTVIGFSCLFTSLIYFKHGSGNVQEFDNL